MYQLYLNLGSDSVFLFAILSYTLYILFGAKKQRVSSVVFTLTSSTIFIILYVSFRYSFDALIASNLLIIQVPYWYFFLCTIATAWFCSKIWLKGTSLNHLIYILFYITTIQLYKICCGPLYQNFGSIDQTHYIIFDLCTSIILYLILFLFVKLFQKYRIEPNFIKLPKSTYIILYFPISLLFFYGICLNYTPLYKYLEPIIAFIIMTNLPIIYYFFAVIIEFYEKNTSLEIALTETDAQLSKFRFSIELEERLKKERHELRNNYFFIQRLLKDNKYEELDNYLEDYIGTNIDTLYAVNSGNLLIDYILNKKIKFAQNNKIRTYTEILLPKHLNIRDDIICTILLNILDNAIEASRQEENPFINITMSTKQNYLTCKIENKISTNVLKINPNLKTTKTYKNDHGLGIEIIKSTVSKANGIINFTSDNNLFSVFFMLPLD